MLGDLVADNKWGVLPPVWTPDKSEVTVERVIDYFLDSHPKQTEMKQYAK